MSWNWRTGIMHNFYKPRPGYARRGLIGKTSRRRKRPSSYPRIGRRLTPELKYHNLVFSQTNALGSGATMHGLNLIAQGDSQSQRVGMRFTIRSIELSLTTVMAQETSVSNSITVRAILFVDTQANGALPVELDLVTPTDSTNALYNVEERHRWKIYMDRTFVINAPGLAWTGAAEVSSQARKLLKYKKSCNLPIFYSSSAAAVTGVTQNNLILFLYVNSTSPGSATAGNIRIRYTDL